MNPATIVPAIPEKEIDALIQVWSNDVEAPEGEGGSLANLKDRYRYLLFGGLAGAAAAILLAPRSGKDTRSLIATKAEEATDVASARVRQAAEMASSAGRNLQAVTKEFVDDSRQAFNKKRERITDAVELAKQAYVDEKERFRQQRE